MIRSKMTRKIIAAIGSLMIFSSCSLLPTKIEPATNTTKAETTAAQSSTGDTKPVEPGTSTDGTTGESTTTAAGTTTAATTAPGTTSATSTTPTTTSGDPKKAMAEELMAGMTPEEKVKQMLIAHYAEGMENSPVPWGGVLFFSAAFEDRSESSVRTLMTDLQQNSKYTLITAVDEEGGTVLRVSRFGQYGADPFKSPSEILNASGLDGVYDDAVAKSQFLRNLGINFNFAPVADVSQDPDSFIYERASQLDSEGTAEYVKSVIKGMNSVGVGSSLKHFPGYGDNIDTHTDIGTDDHSLEYIQERLLPFKAGISAGADSVMVSHLIINAIDPDYPSSISRKVHDVLRKELGFEGVIMTDDLEMQGIVQFSENPEVAAVLAGNDMLITPDPEKMAASILAAVSDGTIPQKTIDDAVMRILTMKLTAGLIR